MGRTSGVTRIKRRFGSHDECECGSAKDVQAKVCMACYDERRTAARWCPVCGSRKDSRSRVCQSCRRLRDVHKYETLHACPKCGGKKSRDSQFCLECRRLWDLRKCVCPGCGGNKSRDAMFCMKCAVKLR